MENSLTQRSTWTWLAVTLLAQTAWGAYPVMTRYLQTVSDLPSMSILALGCLVALLVVGVIFLPRIQLGDLQSRRLLIFALIGMPLVIGYTIYVYRVFKGKTKI